MLITIVEFILLTYAVYVVCYTTTFSIAACFYRPPLLSKNVRFSRFCVLIPCYREDAVIEATARAALRQSYLRSHFDVVVIADGLMPQTLASLRALPIRLLEVSFEVSTKVKSLNTALDTFANSYDYAVVLDADNLIEFEFLEKMNRVIQSRGYQAVQAQRKPKNADTTLAYLDGVSEAINNFVYRQGSTALGLSASINGSGFAVAYSLLQEKLGRMQSVGGFDRELEARLVMDGVHVYYYKDAVVLDEKVSHTEVFRRQRRRWIASQYIYLRKFFAVGLRALGKGDMAAFNTTILRNIQLPRLLNIGLLFTLSFLLYFLRTHLHFGYYAWPALFITMAVATLAAIPRACYSTRLIRALLTLPIVFLQLGSLLFLLRGANRRFLHTPHHFSQIHAERNGK